MTARRPITPPQYDPHAEAIARFSANPPASVVVDDVTAPFPPKPARNEHGDIPMEHPKKSDRRLIAAIAVVVLATLFMAYLVMNMSVAS